MSNDRRESAVYVSIEDRTYIGPPVESGRSVFGIILSDRGEDMKVVTCKSRAEYQKRFGTPNIAKCSQTHYMLDKCFEYTSEILTCRVTPADATFSNIYFYENEETGELIESTFNFNALADSGLEYDEDDVTDPNHPDNPTNIYNVNHTSNPAKYVQVNNYDFSSGDIEVGDWIYPAIENGEVYSRQIISITPNSSGSGSVIKLDDNYSGEIDYSGNIYVKTPYLTSSTSSLVTRNQVVNDNDFIYQFYAVGRGAYYNNIVIKGERNFEMEKMYTNDDGEVLYKYIFLDINIYNRDSFGNLNHLEGPWVVSLVRQTPNGDVIKDFFGGTHIMIEDVINRRSEFVRVRTGNQLYSLSDTNSVSEKKRLQTMLMFLGANPLNLDNIGNADGLPLENGSDGTGLYDQFGNINPSNALNGRLALAYNGGLTSEDGSLEALHDTIYSKYTPDYIVSGGFPINVQYAARGLASGREDCIHLADPGVLNTTYLDDINARMSSVAWNNWTSALYVQYREIYDNYTGRYIWISPVYHAIQRHLDVDNKYFISEPVSNIEKGAIGEQIKLAYDTNHSIRGDLWDKELNYTLEEPDGVYFNSQFSTWKRFSALKRLHVAKFTAYVKKNIPKILKDIIQRKATRYWLSNAQTRCDIFMSKFLDNLTTDRYACIESYNCNLVFDKQRSELNVYITFVPILSIEKISVFVTLESSA